MPTFEVPKTPIRAEFVPSNFPVDPLFFGASSPATARAIHGEPGHFWTGHPVTQLSQGHEEILADITSLYLTPALENSSDRPVPKECEEGRDSRPMVKSQLGNV
jgi:hypothetical protein